MRKENKIDLWKNIYGTANSKRVCYKHQGGNFPILKVWARLIKM